MKKKAGLEPIRATERPDPLAVLATIGHTVALERAVVVLSRLRLAERQRPTIEKAIEVCRKLRGLLIRLAGEARVVAITTVGVDGAEDGWIKSGDLDALKTLNEIYDLTARTGQRAKRMSDEHLRRLHDEICSLINDRFFPFGSPGAAETGAETLGATDDWIALAAELHRIAIVLTAYQGKPKEPGKPGTAPSVARQILLDIAENTTVQFAVEIGLAVGLAPIPRGAEDGRADERKRLTDAINTDLSRRPERKAPT